VRHTCKDLEARGSKTTAAAGQAGPPSRIASTIRVVEMPST
jgi:hypothetical protein